MIRLAIACNRHELRPILGDARSVVHQHKVERVVAPAESRAFERLTSSGLRGLPVPAAIGRPRLLEGLVGGRHVLGVGARLPTARADPEHPLR